MCDLLKFFRAKKDYDKTLTKFTSILEEFLVKYKLKIK